DERNDPRAAWVRREVRWRAELARLDSASRPSATRPVDPNNLDSPSKMPNPMEEAGMREEAQAVRVENLLALECAPEDELRALRGRVGEYKSFFRAACTCEVYPWPDCRYDNQHCPIHYPECDCPDHYPSDKLWCRFLHCPRKEKHATSWKLFVPRERSED